MSRPQLRKNSIIIELNWEGEVLSKGIDFKKMGIDKELTRQRIMALARSAFRTMEFHLKLWDKK